jgi:Asp-tRNA(Asn)/Glu-tRNA(Gln) amidotransferase A subunit family amidase
METVSQLSSLLRKGKLDAVARQFLDRCALSIPNGTDGGMPTGFLFSAQHGRDADILPAGLSLESVIRG